MTQVTCELLRTHRNMAVNMALTSLLVCSDAHAVQVLSRILQDLGIGVEACANLRMARARLADRHYDALLVDCQNESASIELFAHARNTPSNHTTVAIAIVNRGNEARDIFAKGANFILYKPISRERASHSMRAAASLLQSERRIRQRAPLHTNISIAYADKENVPATLVDLSEKGMALRSDSKLPPYCKVYFQFVLPGTTLPIRLSGEVMWQDSSGRVGIRFVRVPQTSRQMLNDWLRSNLRALAEDTASASQRPASADSPVLRLSASLGLLAVSAADRRNLSRHACCLGAKVYRANSHIATRCTLIDISTGGCYVQTAETLPSGTRLEIVVRTHDVRLRIQVKVVSMHPGLGMGVEFNLRTEDQREQVQQLIACAKAPPKTAI